MSAKFAKEHLEGRAEELAGAFHADARFRADVTLVEKRITLVVADGVDGWICAVYYPDTKESITLGQCPDIGDAKARVEGWVRIVHNVSDAIEWIPGPPSIGAAAKSQKPNADFR